LKRLYRAAVCVLVDDWESLCQVEDEGRDAEVFVRILDGSVENWMSLVDSILFLATHNPQCFYKQVSC